MYFWSVQVLVKSILELAALILGLVNGLMLLRGYLRDRSILKVEPVHPDTYQWFFRLPEGECKGLPTRRYGFLAYIDIVNCGRRDVSVSGWRLHGITKGGKRFEMKPMSIQEPKITIREAYTKIYPVLGVRGLQFAGDTMVKSGASMSGFCYYLAEFFGNPNWDVSVHEGTARLEITVQSVFGNIAKTKVIFKEISLEKADKIIPGIANIQSADEDWDDPARVNVFETARSIIY
ncbi:MAG: hypothetical protein JWQ87_3223 [Candidatus Sulfotelmatobacter sp.]|nr:hypothetical protein [Candidatus Sulfotelmatobacter sp.]